MPRRYIKRDDKSTVVDTFDKVYGGSSAEATVLGNTDFDAIYNPIPAFNFVLEVEAVYFLPLKSVRAFTKENEFEYIKEGGVNDYVHLKRKPISKPFTFQIERYIGTERFLDPLALGTELILPLILYVYRHGARQGITASAPAYPARIYTFTGCTVMSKEYGELNAEKSELLTETTTIAYRELIVVNNGFQSTSEQQEWKPDEKDPTTTKYAAFAKNDTPGQSVYEASTNENGYPTINMKEGTKNKHLFKFGKDNIVPTRATESVADIVGTYEGNFMGNSLKRTDDKPFNSPQYEMKKDMEKIKYAKVSPVDDNKGEKIYDLVPGQDGAKHIKRVDHSELNKPAWDGTKEAKPSYAAQSNNDKADNTYKVEVKDGKRIITRKDSSEYNAGAYKFSKTGTKNLRAEVAPLDKNAASPVYAKEGDHIVRKDTSEFNRPQYVMSKDRQNTKYAQKSPMDLPEPEIKEPYSIKDGAEVKYAQKSPVDKPPATPVTWPPTRRALMAQNLKK